MNGLAVADQGFAGSHSEIMDRKCKRALHETEHSVARDLQIRQITAEFDMGPVPIPALLPILLPTPALVLLRVLDPVLLQVLDPVLLPVPALWRTKFLSEWQSQL
jgi:hypothetical protein